MAASSATEMNKLMCGRSIQSERRGQSAEEIRDDDNQRGLPNWHVRDLQSLSTKAQYFRRVLLGRPGVGSPNHKVCRLRGSRCDCCGRPGTFG